MIKTFYSIDRSPEAVAQTGHPKIEAWHSLQARNGFVAESPARQAITTKDAGPLCKAIHGVTLSQARGKGLI